MRKISARSAASAIYNGRFSVFIKMEFEGHGCVAPAEEAAKEVAKEASPMSPSAAPTDEEKELEEAVAMSACPDPDDDRTSDSDSDSEATQMTPPPGPWQFDGSMVGFLRTAAQRRASNSRD